MPARHVYLSACSALQVPAWHIYLGVCSAHLPTYRHVYLSACSALCLLGTVPARHVYLSACSALCLLGTCPTYVRQPDRKKQGGASMGLNHMHMQNRAKNQHVKMTCSKSCHAKNKLFHVSCKKTSCSTCHVMQKNKLFHMSCHAKNRMQNRAKKQAVPHVMQTHIAHIAHIARNPGEWMFSGLPCETHIAHIAHIARNAGRADVQWLAL